MNLAGRPSTAERRRVDVRQATGHSAAVAGWTVVSRVLGLLRVVTIAAVLGPTFFANLYQATNLLPNITYEFLAGSLFASLLVPALVGSVDAGNRAATSRLAGGFLGVALLGFLVVTVVVVAGGPAVVGLLSAAVPDAGASADQRRAGWLLLGLLMPQVLLYGVVGTAVAVQNASGRFAFPAAAPAIENVGIIATFLAYGAVFGTGTALADVGTAQLVLLGAGTTSAVGLHAFAQWWGVHRLGVSLRPRAGWRDPEVRRVVRLAVPSLGSAGLNAGRFLAVLVVAGSVPGGVLAFQLAMNFYNLPVALGGRPIAQAFLPQLARLHEDRDGGRFRDVAVQGASLALFVTVPAAVAYVVLAQPLAAAVSVGAMASAHGIGLLAAALAGLGAGVVGETGFVIATHASYARRDARAPLAATAVRTAVSVLGMVLALRFAGPALLLVLGLAVSAGDLLAAAVLGLVLGRALPPGRSVLRRALGRAGTAAAVMAVPAWAVAAGISTAWAGPLAEVVAVLAAAVVGAAVYVSAQRLLGSPELRALLAVLRPGPRTGAVT
jgi:putative peptidoglycan lipid II flippase